MMPDDDRYEWDAAKAESNRRKHGIDFQVASRVFDDPFAIEDIDRRVLDEERFLFTGMLRGQLLTVVYTERGDRLRIVSARLATRNEHDEYYRQNSRQ